jgi:hypothetical protein
MKLFRGLVAKIDATASRVLHEVETALVSADLNTSAAPLFNDRIMDATTLPGDVNPRATIRTAAGGHISVASLGFKRVQTEPMVYAAYANRVWIDFEPPHEPAAHARCDYPLHRNVKLTLRYAYIREVRTAKPDYGRPFSLLPRQRSRPEPCPPRHSAPDFCDEPLPNVESATLQALQLLAPQGLEPSFVRTSFFPCASPQPPCHGLNPLNCVKSTLSQVLQDLGEHSSYPEPSRFLMKSKNPLNGIELVAKEWKSKPPSNTSVQKNHY